MKENIRSSRLLIAVLFVAVALAVVVWAVGKRGRSGDQGNKSEVPTAIRQAENVTNPESAGAGSQDPEIREVTENPAPAAPPRAFQAANRSQSGDLTPASRTEPTPYSRQLVASLTQIDPTAAGQQADQWRTNLKTLIQQGAGAVPAIREFLERNQELSFGSASDAFGYASLRSALIDALREIGGPDATSAMLQVLRTSALPSEVALIAGNLEQQAPGQYRAESISAINDVLALAHQGQLAGTDVAPLFQALQTMGDSGVATLTSLQAEWRYYSTLALAGTSEGQGVQALIRDAQDPAAGSRRDLAFEMLAQVAVKSPDAANALIEAARAGQLSDAIWRKIASGLAGDQYQLSSPTPSSGTASVSGLKTFHIESGNQNFYSVPVSAIASSEETANRRALAQQLLAIGASPAAAQAMQGAIAALGGSR